MKRACRRLNPIKFVELWATLARFVMVDARTFLLYICRRSNDEKGRMYVCMCVYMCVCVRGEKKERCLQPMDRGEGMTWRLEPGLKWENAPGNAPANCQPTLQRSLRIDVATVRNYSCPLLATFQRIGNSLWNSWNGDLLWWWKYIQNWLDITTLIFATEYYHCCNKKYFKWNWMVWRKIRSFF